MVLQNTCCLIWIDAVELECSPSPSPSSCPEGCPSLASLGSCNLQIILDYGNGETFEHINVNATNFVINDFLTCQLEDNIPDIPAEFGGDINILMTVGYDENCQPSIISRIVTSSCACREHYGLPPAEECDDPGVERCVDVITNLICN